MEHSFKVQQTFFTYKSFYIPAIHAKKNDFGIVIPLWRPIFMSLIVFRDGFSFVILENIYIFLDILGLKKPVLK